MSMTRRFLFAGLTVAALVAAPLVPVAFAQAPAAPAPVITRVRGTVDSVGPHEMTVTTRSGDKVKLTIAEKVGINVIAPIKISAIKPGSYIGTAAVTQPDGTLKALEIQVFPESMRGVGEGHRPWDLGTDSTMTNGTVGDLKVAKGRILKLTYKDGEQTVFVPPKAPIITYLPGTLANVKPGSHVIIFAAQNADGTQTAVRIGVGKGKLVPPM